MTPRKPPRQLLPSHQLAAAVDRMIERADKPHILFAGPLAGAHYSNAPAIRARLGVNERIHYGWRTGGRRNVTIEVADQVLVRTGLCWWDVWNEDTVRLPLLTVTTYVHRRVWRVREGRRVKVQIREAKRVVRYGDRGPDLETLERVRQIWEPALEAAA